MCYTMKRKKLMSKKLFAAAAAAALAVTGLVAIPAQASVSLQFNTAAEVSGDSENITSASVIASTAAGATSPAVAVPSNNVLEYTFTADRKSLMKVTVATTSGEVVNVTTTGKVRVIDAPTNDTNKYTSASGLTAWSKTATGSTVVFYTYTTSTDAGSLKVAIAGNSSEVFFKGSAGSAYNIAVTAPKTVTDTYPVAPVKNLQVKVTDVFGNLIGSGTPVTASVLGSGASMETASGVLVWDATLKAHTTNIKASTPGPVAVSVAITTPATVTAVTGLAAPVASFFATINSVDLAAQVTALEAQVASLQALVAKKVSKKKYNTLARKWNRAHPTAKVALKK
jgi:hypothetical protein